MPITTTLTILLDDPGGAVLGCPRTEAITVNAAQQPFENGLMLWREDDNVIYGLRPDQTWFFTGDTWRDGLDLSEDPALVPPNGLYQPVRGFGKVWRERPGLREALGWATAEEQGFTAVIQEFAGGTVLQEAAGEDGVILLNSGYYQVSGF